MKTSRLSLLAAFLLMLGGCIPSLHPPYTEKDLVSDGRLPGAYEDEDGAVRWVFSDAGEMKYSLAIRDHDKTSTMEARLFKIENQLFLGLHPSMDGLDDCKRDAFFQASVVPAHIFFKVSRLDAEHFEFQSLEADWLKKRLTQSGAPAHAVVRKERIVLTASTAELRKFLAAHLKDPEAWSEPAKMIRRKP